VEVRFAPLVLAVAVSCLIAAAGIPVIAHAHKMHVSFGQAVIGVLAVEVILYLVFVRR
jgi:hypothetical protein